MSRRQPGWWDQGSGEPRTGKGEWAVSLIPQEYLVRGGRCPSGWEKSRVPTVGTLRGRAGDRTVGEEKGTDKTEAGPGLETPGIFTGQE